MDSIPIGVFDSGVGGLSVLRAMRRQFPAHPIIYFADQIHVPYGSRSLGEVRAYSREITRFLLEKGARLVVVACNTASAAALHDLRQTFTSVPFVGMEPAVKPAAESTRTGVVGVLATPATFQSELYFSVVERFARDVKILQDPCPGLVQQIEAGDLIGSKTRRILENALRPMLKAGIDTIVMGCTHYPFVIPLIQEITGPGVRVIDPAPAVARQAGRLITAHGWVSENPQPGWIKFFTSGDPRLFARLLPVLLGETGNVDHIDWEKERIITVLQT